MLELHTQNCGIKSSVNSTAEKPLEEHAVVNGTLPLNPKGNFNFFLNSAPKEDRIWNTEE